MGNRSERFDAAVTELGLAWRSGDQARTAAARVNLERVHCDLMDEAASPPPADEGAARELRWALEHFHDVGWHGYPDAPCSCESCQWAARARAALASPAPRDEAREALGELADSLSDDHHAHLLSERSLRGLAAAHALLSSSATDTKENRNG